MRLCVHVRPAPLASKVVALGAPRAEFNDAVKRVDWRRLLINGRTTTTDEAEELRLNIQQSKCPLFSSR